MIRRRDLITLLSGAAAWPVAARAQQAAVPVIGLLNAQTSAAFQSQLAAFRQGLGDAGLVEGRNLSIVYRSAEGDPARLPSLLAAHVRAVQAHPA